VGMSRQQSRDQGGQEKLAHWGKWGIQSVVNRKGD
jgi:hypothetical protein